MVTRRILTAAIPILFLIRPAFALRPLTRAEARVITAMRTLSASESERFAQIAPLYNQCAETYRVSQPALRRRLLTIGAALAATSSALGAGGRALPDLSGVAAAPPALRDAVRPAASAPPLSLPAPTIATPAPAREATDAALDALISSTRAHATSWADNARTLRGLSGAAGHDLRPAAVHFQEASTQLNLVRLELVGLSMSEAARASESDDPLAAFDVRDLLARARRSETLASQALRTRDEPRLID
jgi:hypothetical protein